jgi:hypothetical protein
MYIYIQTCGNIGGIPTAASSGSAKVCFNSRCGGKAGTSDCADKKPSGENNQWGKNNCCHNNQNQITRNCQVFFTYMHGCLRTHTRTHTHVYTPDIEYIYMRVCMLCVDVCLYSITTPPACARCTMGAQQRTKSQSVVFPLTSGLQVRPCIIWLVCVSFKYYKLYLNLCFIQVVEVLSQCAFSQVLGSFDGIGCSDGVLLKSYPVQPEIASLYSSQLSYTFWCIWCVCSSSL